MISAALLASWGGALPSPAFGDDDAQSGEEGDLEPLGPGGAEAPPVETRVVVTPGASLWQIARDELATDDPALVSRRVRELYEANRRRLGLRSPDVIPAGADLVLPPRPIAPAAASAPGERLVAPGDTLWAIANQELGPGPTSAEIRRHVERIRDANQAEAGWRGEHRITPGQRIVLPAPEGREPVPNAPEMPPPPSPEPAAGAPGAAPEPPAAPSTAATPAASDSAASSPGPGADSGSAGANGSAQTSPPAATPVPAGTPVPPATAAPVPGPRPLPPAIGIPDPVSTPTPTPSPHPTPAPAPGPTPYGLPPAAVRPAELPPPLATYFNELGGLVNGQGGVWRPPQSCADQGTHVAHLQCYTWLGRRLFIYPGLFGGLWADAPGIEALFPGNQSVSQAANDLRAWRFAPWLRWSWFQSFSGLAANPRVGGAAYALYLFLGGHGPIPAAVQSGAATWGGSVAAVQAMRGCTHAVIGLGFRPSRWKLAGCGVVGYVAAAFGAVAAEQAEKQLVGLLGLDEKTFTCLPGARRPWCTQPGGGQAAAPPAGDDEGGDPGDPGQPPLVVLVPVELEEERPAPPGESELPRGPVTLVPHTTTPELPVVVQESDPVGGFLPQAEPVPDEETVVPTLPVPDVEPLPEQETEPAPVFEEPLLAPPVRPSPRPAPSSPRPVGAPPLAPAPVAAPGEAEPEPVPTLEPPVRDSWATEPVRPMPQPVAEPVTVEPEPEPLTAEPLPVADPLGPLHVPRPLVSSDGTWTPTEELTPPGAAVPGAPSWLPSLEGPGFTAPLPGILRPAPAPAQPRVGVIPFPFGGTPPSPPSPRDDDRDRQGGNQSPAVDVGRFELGIKPAPVSQPPAPEAPPRIPPAPTNDPAPANEPAAPAPPADPEPPVSESAPPAEPAPPREPAPAPEARAPAPPAPTQPPPSESGGSDDGGGSGDAGTSPFPLITP